MSASGSLVKRALLEVPAVTRLPPPVISVRPQNLTLAESSTALLTCQAEGTPTPRIVWTREPRPLPEEGPRFITLASGTLQISGKCYLSKFLSYYLCFQYNKLNV